MTQSKLYAIIGGASGMGLAVARRLTERGDRVLIGGRSRERLDAAVSQLGARAEGRVVDAADRDALKAFFAPAGSLDGLFTPGATYKPAPFCEPVEAAARSPFDGKFWTQYWAVHEALPSLRPGAGVVLMSGVASVRPSGTSAAYAACNAAIEGLARGLAVELAPIRVNCVSPGLIDSDLWLNRPAEQREAAAERWRRVSVLQRVGTVEEAADGVLFLLDNGNVTGTTLFLDGGVALR